MAVIGRLRAAQPARRDIYLIEQEIFFAKHIIFLTNRCPFNGGPIIFRKIARGEP
jgi:hypothetical protein